MGHTICLKKTSVVNTLPELAAACDSHEIVTLQRTLPGWVPNTAVYDSLRHARAYPKTSILHFNMFATKKIERAKKNYLGNKFGLFDLQKQMRCWSNQRKEKYS